MTARQDVFQHVLRFRWLLMALMMTLAVSQGAAMAACDGCEDEVSTGSYNTAALQAGDTGATLYTWDEEAGAAVEAGTVGDFAGDASPADKLGEILGEKGGTSDVVATGLWLLVAGVLVFFMNAGFGLVESGFCRSKNAVNILAKNFVVFAIAMVAFWVVGWDIMFGDGTSFAGMSGMLLKGADASPLGDGGAFISGGLPFAYAGSYGSIAWSEAPLEAKFFFQLVFAATAATIVSGAVAERIKFGSFLIFSFVLVAFMYPVTGHWAWGGGLLGDVGPGFHDFAGSTVVHSVGGWAALAGIIVLGPRIGKYRKDGGVNALPGHNMTSVFLGGLILWLGWFGFNPGSTMAANPPGDIAHVAATTAMSAATGILFATLTVTLTTGKPDFGMIVNGCLAGLVGITAPCYVVSLEGAAIIGAVSGILVVLAVTMFDKLHLDDPVGATSVHLVCGIWGTLAVGLFSTDNGLFYGGGAGQLIANLVGVVAVGAFTFIGSLVVWMVLKAVLGIRVSAEEETEGLDFGEHGNFAYPDFQGQAHNIA